MKPSNAGQEQKADYNRSEASLNYLLRVVGLKK